MMGEEGGGMGGMMAHMMSGMFKPGEEGEKNVTEMMEFCGQMMSGSSEEDKRKMINRCMKFMQGMGEKEKRGD